MNKEMTSINSDLKKRELVEKSAEHILRFLSIVSIIAVIVITGYMLMAGTPALLKYGIFDILFGTVWQPTSSNPSFGILYVILTSIVGVTMAVIIAVPIGLLTAIHLSEIATRRSSKWMKTAIELLAGIPSIVYGLLGVQIINPIIYQLELLIFKNSATHQFTGGSNLLAAILVLVIMILPTLISVSENALRAVPNNYRTSSLALGASKMQTIFKVILPSAKSGIISAIVLGIGRAMGEAMAIVLVAGNTIHIPLPFSSVRFLTTAIVSEMGYAQGAHREVLFTIGLVLFVFIILINVMLSAVLKRGEE